MKKRVKIIGNHILNLAEEGDYGICPPPINAQIALDELRRYFLGDDWYSVMSGSVEQINTEIVYSIELKYRGDRKAWKKLKKKGLVQNRRATNGMD